jgi:hypothetical protein
MNTASAVAAVHGRNFHVLSSMNKLSTFFLFLPLWKMKTSSSPNIYLILVATRSNEINKIIYLFRYHQITYSNHKIFIVTREMRRSEAFKLRNLVSTHLNWGRHLVFSKIMLCWLYICAEYFFMCACFLVVFFLFLLLLIFFYWNIVEKQRNII